MFHALKPLDRSLKSVALRISVVLICAAVFGLPYSVKADSEWDGIQITCDKYLNYFALRTITLQDLEPNADDKKHIQQQSNIYDIGHLLKHPYTCDLPAHKVKGSNLKFPARAISIAITNYIAPHERGECSLSEHFDIQLSINGKTIHEFSAYGINRCTDPETLLMELDQLNTLRDCALSRGHKGKTEESSCELFTTK